MIRLIARFTVLLALLITIVVPLSAARAQDGTPEADASASPVAIEVPAPGESATVDKILANGKLRVGVAVGVGPLAGGGVGQRAEVRDHPAVLGEAREQGRGRTLGAVGPGAHHLPGVRCGQL